MKYTLYHNVDKYADVPGEPLNIWGEYRPAHRVAFYFRGDIELDDHPDRLAACEALFVKHNRDDRPCGRLGPSLSIGDVIVFGDAAAFAVGRDGFDVVDPAALLLTDGTYLQWLDDERKERARG